MSKEKDYPNIGGPPPLPPRAPSAPSYQASSEDNDGGAPPPTYDSIFAGQSGNDYSGLAHNDPRSSSTQSLVPSKSEVQSSKRRLFLIYIHGFMGDETSFQSFPAHVHGLVSALVADTHVVHTKIYPRYRSKKKIDFARDDFSRWLAPHEASTSDVILLGHSMGGLLCAEVALIPSHIGSGLRHRLIGTINFDVPFLGMHPGVVKSGLASIFSPAPESTKPPSEAGSSSFTSPVASLQEQGGYFDGNQISSSSQRFSSPLDSRPTDPNYNPAFDNDVVLPIRKGWRNAWHFVNKHSDDLTTATKQLIKSHLEFGSAMADYSNLKSRYARIRALEEQNAGIRSSVLGVSGAPPRVRFVNYYTSSTGRPKKPKSAVLTEVVPEEVDQKSSTLAETGEAPAESLVGLKSPETAGPDLIIEEVVKIEDFVESPGEQDLDVGESMMDSLDPVPMSESGSDTSHAESWVDAAEDMKPVPSETPQADEIELEGPSTDETSQAVSNVATTATPADLSSLSLSTTQSLPPIPELPSKPAALDLAAYTDKDARKLAEKEYGRAMKSYDKAVKDREKAIRDRAKLAEKRERQAIKEGKKVEKQREKSEKELEKEAKKKLKSSETEHEKAMTLEQQTAQKDWKEALDQRWNEADSTIELRSEHNLSKAPTLRSETSRSMSSSTPTSKENEKEKPQKDRTFCSLPPRDGAGVRDPTWVRVLMKDVDEVGAHCGLFFPDERYERLVGEVGDRISEWVNEAESERVAKELEAQE